MVKRGNKPKYIVSKKNEEIIEMMRQDFKIGRNVSVAKGGRKETTLNKNNLSFPLT